ncbi:hypothetical protein [Amphritea pacifica]|uniref:Uncharacterized protein n=1 Tax=Amphritea pacifica TaxID=2811233 RepID=A0ABS2W7J9_9GAMM|nr:hypothetical protein [Amphritea pacifica]MBN0987585.1 hypothetical protein [Amphritea pacifica]MBN1007430.1 hypothetical protein [Amphritea pacifica]
MTRLRDQYRLLLDASLKTAAETLERAGFDSTTLPPLEQFSFETKQEPLNGEDSLNGRWADNHSQRRGWLVVNCDGSMMLEIDLICPWPGKDQVWAESVSVWGREAQLLVGEVTPMAML